MAKETDAQIAEQIRILQETKKTMQDHNRRLELVKEDIWLSTQTLVNGVSEIKRLARQIEAMIERLEGK